MLIRQCEILFENRGFFLFPTALLITIIFVIVIATVELVETEAKINQNQMLAVEALYLAEAGVQMAIHMLEREPNWQIGFKNYPLGEGVIKEVTVEHRNNMVTIESQGEVQGIGRRIRVRLDKIQVPNIHVMETQSLFLRPAAKVKLVGEAVHIGNFTLTHAELEGFLTVEGDVQIINSDFQGALAATGQIIVGDNATIEGTLVSSQGIEHSVNSHLCRLYPYTPVTIPKQSSQLDLHWYYQQPHMPVVEEVLFTDEIGAGFYVAFEDLTLLGGETGFTHEGASAIAVLGSLFVNCSLIPQDPRSDTLVLAAERIILGPGAKEVWGILLATEEIQIQTGPSPTEIFGSLQAPRITILPGTATLNYHPFTGGNLVKRHYTFFQLTEWQEIVLMK